MVKEGCDLKGIPTSLRTKKLATEYNIPLIELEEDTVIDLTIDGADEVDSNLNVINGGGGALTQEKIIAFHSEKMIVVGDETKVVKMLGIDTAVPVEVTKFGWKATKKTVTWKINGSYLSGEMLNRISWRALRFNARKGDSWITRSPEMRSEVVGFEDVQTSAGKFKDCIKIKHVWPLGDDSILT